MRLEKASRKAVDYACKNFHYSKNAAPRAHDCAFSVFNDENEWCGVVCFGLGANSNLPKPYGLKQGQAAELIRVALNGKQNNVSKVLSISIKMFKKVNPLCKLLVSYADVDQGHTGVIYQATNWIYEGKVNVGQRSAFIINGLKTHNKTVYGRGVVQNISEVRKHLDPNATEFITKGKHKYIYPLDKSLIPLCKSLAKPYPKATAELPHKGEDQTFQSEGAFDSTIPLKTVLKQS